MSTEKEGSEIYNMNVDNWGAEIEFRAFGDGYLITNAPKDKPWNENSKGVLIHEGRLVCRNGTGYELVGPEDGMTLNDGEWHQVLLSAESGKVSIYLNGKQVGQVENTVG